MEQKSVQKIENIEINQVEVVEKFCEEIMHKSKKEQLDLTRDFLRANLKNALSPKEKMSAEIEQRILDQKTTKLLSKVFEDKYGICLEWHVIGQVVLNKVGIETVFRIGRIPDGPGHTYLDVKVDKKWEIFDPFAEKFLEDAGYAGGKFQNEYYKESLANKEEDNTN